MNSSSIAASFLLDADRQIENPEIELSAEGIVQSVRSGSTHLGEGIIGPGLLDIHTHGAAGHDVMEGTPAALDQIETFLASRGVAHYLPTTVTASVEDTLRSLDALASRIEAGLRPGLARPIGIHLEGPFISHAKRGVHSSAQLQPPDVNLFTRFQEASRGSIRLLTIAPEVPGALELIAHAVATGVTVSLGHTDATTAETLRGIEAGARSATHTFNAMRALNHREPGILGMVLDDERLYAELICDGIHVAPALIRLWLKAKGPHRAILVTDSMAAAGMPDGRYRLGPLEVEVQAGHCNASGVLAGSVLTLDRAVLNLHTFTSVDVQTAVRFASINPATLLGALDLARVQVGKPASFTQFSLDGRLQSAYIGGRWTVPS